MAAPWILLPVQFSADLLSPLFAWGAFPLAVLAALYALGGLRAIGRAPQRLHLLLGSALALALLWTLNIRLDPGVAAHLLGITTVVLLLGWRLGMVAAMLAQLVLWLLGAVPLALVPLGWLLSAAIPGAVTAGLAWTARFYLPRNPFVFIFICAFFGAGAALLVTWLGAAALLAQAEQPLPSGPGSSLLAFLPLVLFPEAFVNGAMISMLIVYRPDWVRLYDEAFYTRA